MEAEDSDISLSDIESLTEKFLRFKVIMKNKEQIQRKTRADLCKVTNEKEILLNEQEALKKNDKLLEFDHKSSLVMRFFKCTTCRNTFSSSDGLNEHTKEHEKTNEAGDDEVEVVMEKSSEKSTAEGKENLEPPQKPEENPKPVQLKAIKFDCQLRNKSFPSLTEVWRHVPEVHESKEVPKSETKVLF